MPMPFLNAATKNEKQGPPLRLVIIGNPYGMHPKSFFPKDFGRNYTASTELECLEWAKKRLSVFSHTDHNIEGGHFKEAAFLTGMLPRDASRYPDGNISLDQFIGEQLRREVRFPTLNVSAGKSIKESWTRNGVPVPVIGVEELYKKVFVEKDLAAKINEKRGWNRQLSMLDVLNDQYSSFSKKLGVDDKERMDQYMTSVSELNRDIRSKIDWQNAKKPKFNGKIEGMTIQEKYNNLFDMLAVALQTDQTRVATISFPHALKTSDLDLSGNYHSFTHNGKVKGELEGLQTIEKFQLENVSRFMKKLDSIKEPGTNGTLLDHTIVMFGSSMGYGGTHSNRNLPIMLAGGGLKHGGHVDLKQKNGTNTPLCNVFLSIIHKFGIERDAFNLSTGTVTL